jgi:RNA polymerase sigma-70 factor (ECF subfamily)
MRIELLWERALVRRASAGDREAAERLVAQHYPGVFRFLVHLTCHQDEAEELAQETFLKAWPQLGEFEGRSSFRTWLSTIAYREYGMRRRLPEFSELKAEQGDHRLNFVEPLIEALAMERAIATLPEQLRITFIMFQVEELTARETAQILAIPVGTVLSRLHTARQHLRRHLTMREIVTALPASEMQHQEIERTQHHEMSKAVR